MRLNIIIILITLSYTCVSQNNCHLSIEYKAITRGRSLSIIIDSNKCLYNDNQINKNLIPTKEQWTAICFELDKIPLSKLKKLKSSSNRSHTDAAMQASLHVTKGNKSYFSSTFDHGNPPKEIAVLIHLLFSIVEQN